MKKLICMAMVLIMALSLNAKTQVSILVNGYVGWLDWLKSITPEFEKKYPDYEVKVLPAYSVDEQYETKVAIMLQGDNSPDVVFVESTPYLHSYINSKLIAPIPELKDWPEWKNFYPSFPHEMQSKGSYYAVPITAGDVFLFYNKKIFKEAGIETPWKPKNWDDILNAARTIKQKVKGVYPFWSSISTAGELTTMITALMLIEGTNDPLFKDGKWTPWSKGVLDSLKFLETLGKDKTLAPASILLDSKNGNFPELKYATEQKIGILLDGAWVRCMFKGEYEKALDYYDLAPMPTQNGQGTKFVTISGGLMLAISAKTKNMEAAWKFVEFATTKESLLKCSLCSNNMSSRIDVAQDKDYPKVFEIPTSYLEYVRFRPASGDYTFVSLELRDAVENVATLRKTPEEAQKDFAEALEYNLGKDKVVGK